MAASTSDGAECTAGPSHESDQLGSEDMEGATSSTSNQPDSDTVPSLLQRLRSPIPSALSRKRSMKTNPPTGSKRGKGRCVADPKSVSVSDRVKAYPGENFISSNNKLFCPACREEIALKKSVIELHIASQKHKRSKVRVVQKERQERTICDALKVYDKSIHPVGETLPDSVRIRRVKVVMALLKAGVPLAKVDCFRELLEENSTALTSATNLRQLVPFILHEEMQKIKGEIDGRPVSIIFDGTTHVCEAMVIVLCFIGEKWKIQQRVCRLMLLTKSMSGEEVARQLVTVLSTELGIPSSLVIAAARDRASVNNVAMRTVSVIYDQLLDIGCFSHTLDHVGERMRTPNLDTFTKAWISLFSHSPKSRLLWQTQTGLSAPSFSSTRWWSKFEVIAQIHDAFGDVTTFLQNDDLPSTTVTKMSEILNNPGMCRKFKIELAVTVDAMAAFVKATYNLEGDGPLALMAYECVRCLYAHITTEYFPNVSAVAKHLVNGNQTHEQQLIDYAKECVKPAYSYFRSKFDNDLKVSMEAFKAARYFSPLKLAELQPTAADIDALLFLPFLNSNDITTLKSELSTYIAAVEDISKSIDPLEWWESNEERLPNWASAFKKLVLVQPSSAAAERVFSLLSKSFSKLQTRSLEDYVQLSIMLQYNNR